MSETQYTRYADWKPSAHDTRGLGLPDRQDWLVCPCMLTRDSGCLERANYQVTLERLGGESDTVEIGRFGHWACGWLEIVLVHPSRESDLANVTPDDYPVLCEHTLSELEHEQACEDWDNYGANDARREISREYELQPETLDRISDGDLLELLASNGIYESVSDEGTSWEASDLDISRSDLARWILSHRQPIHLAGESESESDGESESESESESATHYAYGNGMPGCLHDGQSGPYASVAEAARGAADNLELSDSERDELASNRILYLQGDRICEVGAAMIEIFEVSADWEPNL